MVSVNKSTRCKPAGVPNQSTCEFAALGPSRTISLTSAGLPITPSGKLLSSFTIAGTPVVSGVKKNLHVAEESSLADAVSETNNPLSVPMYSVNTPPFGEPWAIDVTLAFASNKALFIPFPSSRIAVTVESGAISKTLPAPASPSANNCLLFPSIFNTSTEFTWPISAQFHDDNSDSPPSACKGATTTPIEVAIANAYATESCDNIIESNNSTP